MTISIRTRINTLLIASIAAMVTACASHPSDGSADRSSATNWPKSDIDTSVNHFEFAERSSSAWVSESFEGTKSRQFHGDTLHFKVEQFAADGGLDVGVSHTDATPAPVSVAKTDLHVWSSYSADLEGPGRWWAGPKISVNWQGDEAAKQNGDDWYENYIVEIASSTPDELHDLFMGDYFKGEELPSIEVSGSTYRNYKIRFHSWWQFWSVRQDYRATGLLSIEPIVDTWIAHGLPADRMFDGVKANIETYGPIKGQGTLQISSTAAASDVDCAS